MTNINNRDYSTNAYGYDDDAIIVIAEKEVGTTHRLADAYNMIVFVLEGYASYRLTPEPEKFVMGGQIFFVPSVRICFHKAIQKTKILVFKFKGPVNLYTTSDVRELQKIETHQHDYLPMNKSLLYFAQGVITCMQDGIHSQYWCELKIRELFILLKSYYPRNETEAFLREASNTDGQFSEHVLKYWKNCHSVKQLAASINMTVKQFSSRFIATFGVTPGKWMKRERAHIVHKEIISTKKTFKQIAFENGFTSDSLFTRFCKSTLGAVPSNLRLMKKKNEGQKRQENGYFSQSVE